VVEAQPTAGAQRVAPANIVHLVVQKHIDRLALGALKQHA
jgi:hypothetical protein